MAGSQTGGPVLVALGDDLCHEALSNASYHVVFMSCSTFAKLDREGFSDLKADVVVSALFCQQIDCIEVGHYLSKFAFQGTFLIHADSLPNPKIIARELRQLYPELNFQIVGTDQITDVLGKIGNRPCQ